MENDIYMLQMKFYYIIAKRNKWLITRPLSHTHTHTHNRSLSFDIEWGDAFFIYLANGSSLNWFNKNCMFLYFVILKGQKLCDYLFYFKKKLFQLLYYFVLYWCDIFLLKITDCILLSEIIFQNNYFPARSVLT